MNQRVKTIIFFGVFSLFFLVFSLTIVSYYFLYQTSSPPLINFFVKYHVFFMFAIAFLGLLFGFLSHILFNKEISKNKEELRKTLDIFLSLLPIEERKIIKFLAKNNGVATQYELTKIENMNKLKVHRAIEKLTQKRIVAKEKIGKINKIYLDKEFL